MNANTKVQIDAYNLVQKTVKKLAAQGKLSARLFSDDDLEDIASDTYMAILPTLSKYDPAKAKLNTFLYQPILQKVYAVAVKLRRGGITNAGDRHLEFYEYPADDDVFNENPADETSRATIPVDVAQPLEYMTYADTPDGLEVPGTIEHDIRAYRALRVKALRRLLRYLPQKQRREVYLRHIHGIRALRGRNPNIELPRLRTRLKRYLRRMRYQLEQNSL